jgi:hypothetical protein
MNDQPIMLAHAVLSERAERIRGLVGVARHCIIEIGQELIVAVQPNHPCVEAKYVVPH